MDDKILFKKMSLRLNMCSVRIEPRDAHLDEKTIRKQKYIGIKVGNG